MSLENTEKVVKVIFAAAGALLSRIFGSLDVFLYVLFYMAMADYITGLMASYKQKIAINSRRAKEGINSKIYMFILVGAAYLVGNHILHMNNTLRDGALFWYIGKEFISLLENGLHMGGPVPQFLRAAIQPLESDCYKGEEANGKTDSN
ncbi:MAG: phage holin family protein [Carboxydocellales bacterium]